eukprot:scaffold2612_cov267-Chaetoceros_neogracile.AAC.18
MRKPYERGWRSNSFKCYECIGGRSHVESLDMLRLRCQRRCLDHLNLMPDCHQMMIEMPVPCWYACDCCWRRMQHKGQRVLIDDS